MFASDYAAISAADTRQLVRFPDEFHEHTLMAHKL